MAFTITINLGDVSPNITNVQVFTCDMDCNSCVPLNGYENVPVTSFPLQIMGLNDSINKIKVVSLGSECGSLSQCLTINKPIPTTESTTLPPTTESTTLPPTTEATTLPPTTESTTLPPTTQGPLCRTYVFGYSGSQQNHIGKVTYIDCDDITRVATLTWDESNGNYYNISICALSIVSLEGTIIDETNYDEHTLCVPPKMLYYRAYSYVNSGDDITMWYLDRYGNEKKVIAYGQGGPTNLYVEVYACAIEGSVSINRGTIEVIGTC